MPDVVVVLSGGIRLSKQGAYPTPWTQARVDAALAHLSHQPYFLAASGYSPHAPHAREGGVPEAQVLAAGLRQGGAEARKILVEVTSGDTIGNGYFAFSQHILPRAWNHVLVITSSFHMSRAKFIFEWMADLFGYAGRLDFEEAPDRGLDGKVLEARRQKELLRLESLRRLRERTENLHDFHEWLFFEHELYSAFGDESAEVCAANASY